jgi:hypothetical protein
LKRAPLKGLLNIIPAFLTFTGDRRVFTGGRSFTGKKLFFENPEQDRQHHRNDNARGQGKIKLNISRPEEEVTW